MTGSCEIWADVPVRGLKGIIQVSSKGRIKRLKRTHQTSNRWGKMNRTRKGGIVKFCESQKYYSIAISNLENKKYYLVHRLVAITFIPKVKGKRFVNHKDGNKHNNEAENLEWCTTKENNHHSRNSLGNVARKWKGKFGGNHNTARKIIQKDLSGKKIKEWSSIIEAARHYNVARGGIGNALSGHRQTAAGFKWEYA